MYKGRIGKYEGRIGRYEERIGRYKGRYEGLRGGRVGPQYSAENGRRTVSGSV